jgi:hypothetical protein
MQKAQPLQEVYSKLSDEAARRLSHIVKDVEEGKELVLRTPFQREVDAGEVLEHFTEEVVNPNLHLLNVTLKEIEAAQKSKFGARSIQVPWSERKENLLKSFNIQSTAVEFDNPIDLPGRGQLRPVSHSRSLDAMKRSTSSGLPYLLRKGIVLDRNMPVELEDWPAVLFTRTQEGRKTRDVWGYPIGALALEGQYFLPFFDKFRHHPCVAAYSGPDAVDEAVSKILYTKEQSDVVYSEDFSGFDQSVSPAICGKVFEYISGCFQTQDAIDNDIAAISHNFANIGICTPDGIYAGPHGIPSGSWFTSVVGSYVHLIVQNAVKEITERRNQVMGDDGVMSLPASFRKNDIIDVYQEYGLTLNDEKTFESDKEVIYLQRLYSPDYIVDGIHRGVYPVYRALNRIIHMERWTNMEQIRGADYFSIRTIAILENCKWHPLFAEFVKWVYGKDKYNLEYTYQGLREYIRQFQTKTITDVQNQYSDNVRGIADFDTMKILRTL